MPITPTTLDICTACLLFVISTTTQIYCVVFETLGSRLVFQKAGLVKSLSCLSLI